MQCCDITHDITVPPDDITSKHKKTHSDMARLKCVNMKLPKNGCKSLGRDHPDCWMVHVMPHPPQHIWACPHNWSLQPLYLSTLYYNRCTFTNLQIYTSEDCVALVPCQLRVPPPPTPMHALQPPFPVVTPAPVGSNVLGSGHQLWRRSLTVGHQRQDVPPRP